MEPIEITILASYNDFKKFLNDFLCIIHKGARKTVLERQKSDGKFILQYSFLGSLIIYKIWIIDKESLDIEISIPINCSENLEIHITDVIKEIRERFSPAKLPFGFKNLNLKNGYTEILDERWQESERTQLANAYLSTIILLGSILEGILLYTIQTNPQKANKSDFSPKDEDDKPRQFKDWSLDQMINVCHDCGWISSDTKGFSQTVQQYRNFVHPWKQLEYKLGMPTKNTCKLSRLAIENVLEELVKV